MADFEKILPREITDAAVRSGNEWVLPLTEAQKAVELATEHRIAVLGVEIFRIVGGGLVTEGYAGYEFEFDGDCLSSSLETIKPPRNISVNISSGMATVIY